MKVLITGGAGFIGCNIAEYYLNRGDEVIVLDDLSRPGAETNLAWLRSLGKIDFIKQDIREIKGLKRNIEKRGSIDLICHMAAQVAVTTSVTDPETDFHTNALGTFNVLESVRQAGIDPVIIYASTNKVYGEMTDLNVIEKDGRYQYEDMAQGISEKRPLDFHSPYGCSKGSADQYVIDYSRIYGVRTVCMRQSCVYGKRQFGIEDQGWVAWFIIAAVLGRPITIYGDGKQVRDILYVEDLVRLYHAAYENIGTVKGMAFNVGGGTQNQLSLLELIGILRRKSGEELKISFAGWRPGDQKIFVSDIGRAKKILNWVPETDSARGIDLLWEWVVCNKDLFENF
ncbi:MAG: SDR family NAD(P)-dependent oxidoreductase [Candidatus Omnitrophota bacterium]